MLNICRFERYGFVKAIERVVSLVLALKREQVFWRENGRCLLQS